MAIDEKDLVTFDEEGKHSKEERMQDLFSKAAYKTGNWTQRKQVVNLLNIFSSLNYHRRLGKFHDASDFRYMLLPLDTEEVGEKTVLDKDQIIFIGNELNGVANTVDEHPREKRVGIPESVGAEELIIGLCERFSSDIIDFEIFYHALKDVVVRDAEIAFLEQTNRLP